MLGALVASVFWVGMYVGVSYFLGEEVAKRIGAAGTKALFGVILLVVIGLAARAVWSHWRAHHEEQSASA
jgi:membrane protein DedA with SNARE-associated domain